MAEKEEKKEAPERDQDIDRAHLEAVFVMLCDTYQQMGDCLKRMGSQMEVLIKRLEYLEKEKEAHDRASKKKKT